MDFDDADLDVAVHQMVDDLTSNLLNIDAPDWYINPAFKVVLSEHSAYDSIAAYSLLSSPPYLHDVFRSSQPLSLDFYKSLPNYTGKMWESMPALSKRLVANPSFISAQAQMQNMEFRKGLAIIGLVAPSLAASSVTHSIRATTLQTNICSAGRRCHQRASFPVSELAF